MLIPKKLLIYSILPTVEPKRNPFKIYLDVYYHISPMEVRVSHFIFEHGWISPDAKKPTMILLYSKSKCSISHMLSRQLIPSMYP